MKYMLEQLLPDKAQKEGELTLVNPVSEKDCRKQFMNCTSTQDILITANAQLTLVKLYGQWCDACI